MLESKNLNSFKFRVDNSETTRSLNLGQLGIIDSSGTSTENEGAHEHDNLKDLNFEDSSAEKLNFEITVWRLLRENDELKSSNGLILQENEGLKDLVNRLKTKLDRRFTEQSQQNEDMISTLTQENTELKSSVNDLKTKVDLLSKKKSQLNEDMISTQKIYQEEKTSNNELQAKVDILSKENTELKQKVDYCFKKKIQQNEKNQEFLDSKKEFQEKIDFLTHENTELKSSVNEKEKINKILLQDKYE